MSPLCRPRPAPGCLTKALPPALAQGHPGQLGGPTSSTEATPPPAGCPSLPLSRLLGRDGDTRPPLGDGGSLAPALGVGVDPRVLSTTSPHIRQVLPTEYPPSPPAPDVMEPKEEQPPMPSPPTEEEDEDEEDEETEEDEDEEDEDSQGEQPKVGV